MYAPFTSLTKTGMGESCTSFLLQSQSKKILKDCFSNSYYLIENANPQEYVPAARSIRSFFFCKKGDFISHNDPNGA